MYGAIDRDNGGISKPGELRFINKKEAEEETKIVKVLLWSLGGVNWFV